MHRMLLALWLVGAAIYAGFGLITPPDQPVVETAKRADRGPAQPSKAAAPRKTAIVEPTAPAPAHAPGVNPEAAVPGDRPPLTGTMTADAAAQEQLHTDPGEVSHAAPVHSGPSVTSPIVGYAAAGAQVELLERRAGWVKFVDPETQKEGWIYEIYVSTETQKGLEAEPVPEPLEEAAIAPPSDAGLSEPRRSKHSIRSKQSQKRFVSKRKRFKFARRFRHR